MVENTIISIIKKYLVSLTAMGIHASKAILFGSFAKGNANTWSDIDLVVIAPEFDKPRERTQIQSLWRATIIDSRIEPIPCGEKEWLTDQSRPILEIARQEGLVVTAAN
jgi:predicted nucleotidyltransferase